MDNRKEETGRQSAGQQGEQRGHRERPAGLQSPETQAGGRAAGKHTWASEPADMGGATARAHTAVHTQDPEARPRLRAHHCSTRCRKIDWHLCPNPGETNVPPESCQAVPNVQKKNRGQSDAHSTHSRKLWEDMGPAVQSAWEVRGPAGRERRQETRGSARAQSPRGHPHGGVLGRPVPRRARRPGTGRPHTVPSEKPRGWEG